MGGIDGSSLASMHSSGVGQLDVPTDVVGGQLHQWTRTACLIQESGPHTSVLNIGHAQPVTVGQRAALTLDHDRDTAVVTASGDQVTHTSDIAAAHGGGDGVINQPIADQSLSDSACQLGRFAIGGGQQQRLTAIQMVGHVGVNGALLHLLAGAAP